MGMKNGRKGRIYLTTLGCAKNLVDSESLLAQLRGNHLEVVESPGRADVAVVNTCGFIEAAKQESIATILQLARMKEKGLDRLVVMGCFSERYRCEILKELPEVDAVFGVHDLPAVVRELGGEYRHELLGERELTTPGHYAYLKISEGCDNPCSFCAIPLIRGRHVSRPVDELVREAKGLASRGVKELVVIGQDTTYYGLDLSGSRSLSGLLYGLAEVEGIEWIRLMYTYPAKFPGDVLKAFREIPKVCRYIDMPVQHASDTVLRSMRRGISSRVMRNLVEEIRSIVPGIAIRTTLIVGYPGEGEKEFEELAEFVRQMRFERLGVFTYSPEEGTAAFDLGDPVPQDEKERRLDRIMEIQRGIAGEISAAAVGSTLRVLVDREEDEHLVARTEWDAPEIDNDVLLPRDVGVKPGGFVNVRVVDAEDFDLYGEIV